MNSDITLKVNIHANIIVFIYTVQERQIKPHKAVPDAVWYLCCPRTCYSDLLSFKSETTGCSTVATICRHNQSS